MSPNLFSPLTNRNACICQTCQVDLVKDNGHNYFIKFLDSPDIYPEQRSMAAFVVAVIADNHFRGQQVCVQGGMIQICLSYIQSARNNSEGQAEPLLLQWLCLCLAKIWDGNIEGAQSVAISNNAHVILSQLLVDYHPEVWFVLHLMLCVFTSYLTLNMPGSQRCATNCL